MSKYEQLASEIIKNVGGKENINGLTHCVTRLRFQLEDEAQANDSAIKNMEGVVTLMKSAGQYQVVIGNHVPDVYKEVCVQAGISNSTAVTKAKKMGVGATLMDFISGVMTPILAVMAASGMIKGVLSIAEFSGWISASSDLYSLCHAIGDAFFYFFPVLLGYTTANKLKIDPFVGVVIGAGLMYPTIQAVDLTIFGLAINVSYSNTVLPVILTTLAASYLYKGLQKIVPDVVKTFIVPMLTLMVAIPAGFLIIGPISNWISNGVADGIMSVYSLSPILAGIVIGAIWQVLVIFGIHMGLVAVAIMQFASGSPTPLFALAGTASFAQTAVVFAIWLKTKDKKLKSIALPAWISGIFGVTEPAIYGVTLPRVKFFVISCIGSACGGMYAGFAGVLAYQMAGMGIFSYPMFYGGHLSVGEATLQMSIAFLIAMVVSFVGTFILYKDETQTESNQESSSNAEEVIAVPIKGTTLPLSEIKDEAFSLGILGKGIAIEPAEGKVFAPVDGTVTTLFPSLHAIGITGDNGLQILIHVGMDTVELGGKGFKAHVKQDDRVKKGQLLLEFDIDLIKENGYSLSTPVVITNSNDLKEVTEIASGEISVSDDLLLAKF